jgi:hypothetical protein
MQIPPSTALLHALSRIGETPSAPRQAAAARADAATETTRAVTTPDAARAAAKAAFQALRPAQPAPANAVTQPQPQTAVQQQPLARQLPRGSCLNLVV